MSLPESLTEPTTSFSVDVRPVVSATLAVFFGGLLEGITGAYHSEDTGLLDALATTLAGAGLVVLWLSLPALLCALPLCQPGPRTALDRVLNSLAGVTPGRVTGRRLFARVWTIASLCLSVLLGLEMDELLAGFVSERFALVGTLVTVAVLSLGSLLIGAMFVGRYATRLLRYIPAAWEDTVTWVTLAAATLLAVPYLLPTMYAGLPVGLWLGLGVAATPWARSWTSARPRTFFVLALVAPAVYSLLAVLLLPSIGAGAKRAVLYQGPYTSVGIATTWKLVDRDGDGSSPILLGGDCDDGDATVHPRARDIPANGIDENCTGLDAAEYAPIPGPAWDRPVDEPPNIVVFMMDSLRPDHLRSSGYERETSPHLDALRERSVWFDRAYTPAPSTRFAMASAFTGEDARRLPHQDYGVNAYRLLPEANTFAEQLRSAGYETVGYTISYVTQHNPGIGQGFARWNTPWPAQDWRTNYPRMATLTSDAALTVLAEERSKPLLLFLHYRCTHDPYSAKPEYDFGSEPIDLYDSAMRYCDEEVGRVLSRLEEPPYAERTAVVMFSDHGELFGEHGLTNHGNSVFEPDVRIALSLMAPGFSPSVVTQPVSLSDLAPTITALAGVEASGETGAWNLLPLAVGAQSEERTLFLFTDLRRGPVHYQARSALRWPFKLIFDVGSESSYLYNLEEDPLETTDISEQETQRYRELEEAMDAYQAYAQDIAE